MTKIAEKDEDCPITQSFSFNKDIRKKNSKIILSTLKRKKI
jgi:hypothetical protein